MLYTKTDFEEALVMALARASIVLVSGNNVSVRQKDALMGIAGVTSQSLKIWDSNSFNRQSL